MRYGKSPNRLRERLTHDSQVYTRVAKFPDVGMRIRSASPSIRELNCVVRASSADTNHLAVWAVGRAERVMAVG